MNIDRALVSVRKVTGVADIEGADLITLVYIDGWQVVTQKSNGFKVGDLVLYAEIDAFLPGDDPRFESFRERFTTFNGKEGLRVKTIKLRKQLSQGLVLPLSLFPEIKNPVEGLDVTDLLKVVKWESEEDSKGGFSMMPSKKQADFPSFIPKTDQPRAQNIVGRLKQSYVKEELFERTIKMDGSSMTVYCVQPDSKYFRQALDIKIKKNRPKGVIKGFLFDAKLWFDIKFTDKYNDPITAVCSRNLQLKDDDGSDFWNAAIKYDLVEQIHSLSGSFAFQGELIGPNIQKGYEKVKELEFRLFDIYDIENQTYIAPLKRHAMIANMNIRHVPNDSAIKLSDITDDIENLIPALLEAAEGPGMNSGVLREGHVYKSLSDPNNNTFKIVSVNYLLAKEGVKVKAPKEVKKVEEQLAA